MADEILNEEEAVNIVTTYEAVDGVLKEVKTPVKIVAEVKTYDITSVKEEIEKINNAIAQWEAKKAPLETIIAKYDEIKPEEEPVEEPK
jgi:gas vesicle protein